MGRSVSLAEDVLRRLAALPEGAVRDRAAVRFISVLPAEGAAELLEHAVETLRGGSSGVGAAASVLQSVLPDSGLGQEQRAAIYASAKAEGFLVATLFLSPPAHKEAGDVDPKGEAGLSLGHRRSLARTVPPERFERLGAASDARVAIELLRNPRFTERDAVQLASRRPAQAKVLEAIACSPRFSKRLRVRTALARNPFAPTPLALRLLPRLPGALLREIAADSTLHPLVRQYASALVGAGTP